MGLKFRASFFVRKKDAKTQSKGLTAPLHLTVRRTQRSKGRRCSGRRKLGAGSRACPLNDPRSRREAEPVEQGLLQERGITKISLSLAEDLLKVSPLGYGRGIVKGRVFRPSTNRSATTALSPFVYPNTA